MFDNNYKFIYRNELQAINLGSRKIPGRQPSVFETHLTGQHGAHAKSRKVVQTRCPFTHRDPASKASTFTPFNLWYSGQDFTFP